MTCNELVGAQNSPELSDSAARQARSLPASFSSVTVRHQRAGIVQPHHPRLRRPRQEVGVDLVELARVALLPVVEERVGGVRARTARRLVQ